MLIKHWLVLKTYSLIITILYSLALATVCLIKVDKLVEEVHIQNADKIFHFSAYFVLAILWYVTLFFQFKINKNKSIIYAICFSVVFGIIIEVLQGAITTSRQSDINDVFANTLGALLATLVIYIKNRILIKKI
ncbi:VanZ family protein [Yeosuana marina]|uniref:VanZ family protein n=1 Tax=Yeosuana marina TaxID=1565536 RepID=UPI0030EF1420|tara:strand:- start:210 stop:611 length:402 start_codon:yes stop_codon:yes gene_type:complete